VVLDKPVSGAGLISAIDRVWSKSQRH
jgi:hypothetical protein